MPRKILKYLAPYEAQNIKEVVHVGLNFACMPWGKFRDRESERDIF